MLTAKALCERLAIDRAQLNRWIAQGLPTEGKPRRRTFNPQAVREWLLANNLASVQTAEPVADDRILRTRDEVATAMGVSTRTVATWIREGMPGEVGDPGRQNGKFPLAAIRRWAAERKGTSFGGDPADSRAAAQARLARIRADVLEARMAMELGRYVDADLHTAAWARHIAAAKALLNQLPAEILRRLPAGIDAQERALIRADVAKAIDQVYSLLAEFCADELARLEAEDGD